MSHYKTYVINVYSRFVLYFHLHYQVTPKIACMFLKPYEVRKQFLLKYAFCWTNMIKKYFWKRNNIFFKAIWPSQITVNIGHCMSMKLNNGNTQRIQHVNKCLYPNASSIRWIRYVLANPDITMWLQNQASLFSRLYFERLHAKQSELRVPQNAAITNRNSFFFPRSSFSWSIIAVTAEYLIAVAHP